MINYIEFLKYDLLHKLAKNYPYEFNNFIYSFAKFRICRQESNSDSESRYFDNTLNPIIQNPTKK